MNENVVSVLNPQSPWGWHVAEGLIEIRISSLVKRNKWEEKDMTRVGFEPTPGYPDEKPAVAGKLSLESHALDRSAILPYRTYEK